MVLGVTPPASARLTTYYLCKSIKTTKLVQASTCSWSATLEQHGSTCLSVET